MNNSVVYTLFATLFGLCWGSFLNVVSYRITFDKNFWAPRSACPHCTTIIAWYHNIPVISYLLLGGKCISCKNKISWLYPAVEIVTALLFGLLAFQYLPEKTELFLFYCFFASALVAATRSDLEAMVIPQCFSLYLIPVGVMCAAIGVSNISPIESVITACIGYGTLWSVSKLFKLLRKQEGLGIGDAELLAMIGSCIGIIDMWNALMIGSSIGCVTISFYLWYSGKGRETRIPFAPFLAVGALISILILS